MNWNWGTSQVEGPILKKELLLLFCGFASHSFGFAKLGSQTVTLSTSPTQLACSTQRYVNKITVRVIPGFEGKVFVGTPAMEVSTYDGTLAILYPNFGAHSEEYVLQDKSGDDGIDLCSIYIAGEIAGEYAVAEYISNNDGTTAPAYLLTPLFAGTETVYGSYFSTQDVAAFRLQIIPGEWYGKQFEVIDSADTNSIAAELSPNGGTLSEHNAWSESFEVSDPLGSNGLSGLWLWVGNDGPGLAQLDRTETALLSVTEKVANGEPQTPSVMWQIVSGQVFFDDQGTSFDAGNIFDLQITKNRWDNSETYIGDCSGSANGNDGQLGRILFPNQFAGDNPVGFSETIWYGVGQIAGSSFCVSSDEPGVIGDASVTYLTPQSGASAIPTVIASPAAQTGGWITPALSGTSIGRGNAKRLVASVIPGGEGKMYIGSATMNTSTLDGVYAILYPNAVGRWSETLELDDPEGDGIPTNSFYVQPEIQGESVLVSTLATGVVPSDGVLTVKAGGPLSGSFSSSAIPFAASSTLIAILRAQAIPGGDGKLWIGTASMTAAQPDNTYANVLKVLWPSQGNYDIGEGHSERFTQACSTGPVSAPNCLDLASFTFWPEIPSEQLLVFALGR